MKELILVFFGSGLGGILRYLIYMIFAKESPTFPFYTLIANLLACILVGFLMEKWMTNSSYEPWRLFIIVGFCGGLSTYSSFNYELYSFLLKSQFTSFVIYSGVTYLGCLIAIQMGSLLAQFLKI